MHPTRPVAYTVPKKIPAGFPRRGPSCLQPGNFLLVVDIHRIRRTRARTCETREQLALARCIQGFHVDTELRHIDLELDVVTTIGTRSRRDQVTDNDVLLQTDQLVACTAYCGVRQHACGLLERCSADER